MYIIKVVLILEIGGSKLMELKKIKCTGRELSELVQNFRIMQENNFYDLPFKVIIILLDNYNIISKYYNILDNTKQIVQKRANYKNYEENLKKIDDFVFSFEIQKISYNDIKNSNLPINIISTIFLFIEEG